LRSAGDANLDKEPLEPTNETARQHGAEVNSRPKALLT
jgi:hypothetical protein